MESQWSQHRSQWLLPDSKIIRDQNPASQSSSKGAVLGSGALRIGEETGVGHQSTSNATSSNNDGNLGEAKLDGSAVGNSTKMDGLQLATLMDKNGDGAIISEGEQIEALEDEPLDDKEANGKSENETEAFSDEGGNCDYDYNSDVGQGPASSMYCASSLSLPSRPASNPAAADLTTTTPLFDELDPSVDTRLLLLRHFPPGAHVPVRARVEFRLTAFKRSVRALVGELAWGSGSSFAREVGCVVLAWFVILSFEPFRPESEQTSAIFNVIFEACSAFGNVGLSLGSLKHPFCSFSADLKLQSQFVLLLLMVAGRAREFPREVDGALRLAPSGLVAASFLKPGAVVRRAH